MATWREDSSFLRGTKGAGDVDVETEALKKSGREHGKKRRGIKQQQVRIRFINIQGGPNTGK